MIPKEKDLEREDLERDLVNRDKQALISDCLRLFDTNVQLVATNNKLSDRVHDLEVDIKFIGPELERVTNFSGPAMIWAGMKRTIGL